MVEADHTVGDVGALTPAAVAQDLVPLADLLDRDVEEIVGGGLGVAAEPVRDAVREQGEAARLQEAGAGAVDVGVDVQPAVPGGDHHQRHQLRQRWHGYAPGRGQLGPAVERAGQAQQVQRLAEEVAGSGRSTDAIVHARHSAACPSRPPVWMNG
ncbi:hypothetical protein GCM10020001_111780 [Nonomuraea salmonea]